MSDLQARLDALPEWPEPCSYAARSGEVCSDCSNCFDVAQETAAAALARLALAREWIEREGHVINCDHYRKGRKEPGGPRWIDGPCTCGRDALLKAMEVPRD